MPEPTPRTETPLTPAQRWTRALAVLVFGLAMLLLLSFPWTLGALILGPLTAVVGIIALTARWSGELTRWARINAVVAIVLGGFATLQAAAVMVFFTPFNDLATCQARAITHSAEQQCQADFDQALSDLLARYGVELPSTD